MNGEKPTTKYINRKAFAEYIGCTPGRVGQAITEGLISEDSLVRDNGRVIGIDWEQAVDEWAMKYDQGNNPTSKVATTMRNYLREKRGEPLTTENDSGTVDYTGVRALDESKRIEAHYKAEIARMDKEEREGQLVRKDEVRKQLHSFGVEVRVALQSVPDRVVDNVIGKSDRNEVMRIISDEINEQLNKLTEVVERDFSR